MKKLIAVFLFLLFPTLAAADGHRMSMEEGAAMLTDQMAERLDLEGYMVEETYEINYDFLKGIRKAIKRCAHVETKGHPAYDRITLRRAQEERADRFKGLLSESQYDEFMLMEQERHRNLKLGRHM